jgi:hypothetical protein
MSQQFRMDRVPQSQSAWMGPSEPESHTEHEAALDATLFHSAGEASELVLELEAGELRVRRSPAP